jgi:hypothetical protein
MLLVLDVHPEASRLHPGNLDHAGDAWRAAEVVRETAEMIRGRLAASGIAEEAVVEQRGGGRLTVEVPEVRYAALVHPAEVVVREVQRGIASWQSARTARCGRCHSSAGSSCATSTWLCDDCATLAMRSLSWSQL